MERPDAGEQVLLIGFQNQPNLGLGYLAATLRARGVTVRLLDVQDGRRRSCGQPSSPARP